MSIRPLKDICLNFIIRRFSKFYKFFLAESDPKLKKCFDFLQEWYSVILLEKYTKSKMLRPEYLRFFLNEHLRELNVRSLLPCTTAQVLKALDFTRSGLIKVVSCSDVFKDDVDIRALLECIPSVEDLRLDVSVGRKTIDAISHSCPRLKRLQVCVKGESGGDARWNVLRILEVMPRLERLACNNLLTSIVAQYADDLADGGLVGERAYGLVELDFGEIADELGGRELSLFMRVCARVCPRVKAITVAISSEEPLQAICEFAELKRASIRVQDRCFRLDLDGFFIRASGRKLAHATFARCRVSVSQLLCACPGLKSLRLERCHFAPSGGGGGDCLGVLSSLEDLAVDAGMRCSSSLLDAHSGHKPFAISLIQILRSSPNLRSLALTRCDVQNPALKEEVLQVASRGALRCLDVSNSYVVDVKFLGSILKSSSALEVLDIRQCWKVGIHDVNKLREMHMAVKILFRK